MNALLKSCLLAAGLVVAQLSLAQTPAVSSTLTAARVETVAGKEVLARADNGKPGDLVEYAGNYHNATNHAVDKLMATIPVPTGTTFVAGSASPGAAQASTDGVRFAPMPLMRSVRKPDGTFRQEPVPLAEYRFVRWELGTLAGGADTVVKLRVQIDSNAATASAKP